MKRIVFWILFAWLGHDTLPAQAGDVPGSAPAAASRLFYLQRSKDANTVVYQANVLADQKLSPQKPVDVFWIRYAEQGQREELSSIQWQLAYGYQHRACADKPDSYELRLNAYPKRPLKVVHSQGKTVAMIVINGQNAHLQKIFIQLASSFHLVPKVAYIELFGVDPDSGQSVYERIPI
ncbi:DUF4833 domain-containing protein [Spirosoma validum]|uniref:DUF4833 domain-containing protein n=1 Tax=Spirosoma validum TaxID=2771355 RepID=A0A927B3U3_9BACT|nr:DUF4833 domain-containing protein [Spirosoma validum]MBD2755121.1 DUF4833 domain-containing protein [Spirosoma validum]